jgi:hypothetical protein
MPDRITISAHKTLHQINEEFSARFPDLRLTFYTEKHGVGEESSLWDTANMKLPLSQVGTCEQDEDFTLSGEMSVSDFEAKFQDRFGLGVQIMYFRAGSWHQTRSSDDWTLAQQNTQSHQNRMDA